LTSTSSASRPLRTDASTHLTSLAVAGDTSSFPAHAELVRTLIEAGRFATLTTLTVASDVARGFPYGSLVAYSPLADGSPLVCISELAEHTRNAHADRRAGMLLTGLPVDTGADPLDHPRASLVGRLEPYDPREVEVAAHLERHPGTEDYAGFPDFGWWRLAIDAARYVGGFGHMSWVTGAAIADAEPDPVVGVAQGAIDHMNADHADANLAMVRQLAGVPGATAARVHAIDRHGVTLYATVPGAGARVTARLAFAGGPLDSPDQIRAAVVALTRAARASATDAGGAE
jgi:putative heme iron utilization protein